MAEINKARFWNGVLYPENMLPDWESKIGDILEIPYSYCIHDMDLEKDGDDRKIHVHIIIAFPNTTTKKHAFNVFDLLSADGKHCLSQCKAVISIRGSYDYLLHDTETAKKDGKFQYPKASRITGNNFDIGAYEQLGVAEKNDMCMELCTAIMEECICNFGDFYMYVITNFDSSYFEILKSYSGLFERLTKANYQKHGGGKAES